MEESVAGTANAEFHPAPHKKDARLMGKGVEYHNEGVPVPSYRALKDTVRCSVVCQDHASLVAAHAALLIGDQFECSSAIYNEGRLVSGSRLG